MTVGADPVTNLLIHTHTHKSSTVKIIWRQSFCDSHSCHKTPDVQKLSLCRQGRSVTPVRTETERGKFKLADVPIQLSLIPSSSFNQELFTATFLFVVFRFNCFCTRSLQIMCYVSFTFHFLFIFFKDKINHYVLFLYFRLLLRDFIFFKTFSRVQ